MMPPLVVRVARARAKTDDRGAENRTDGRHRGQAAQPILPLQRIRMNHVEGAGNRGHGQMAFLYFTGHLTGQFRGDVFRHGRQAGAGKVELNAVQTVGHNGIECFGQRRANKCFGKNSELHRDASKYLGKDMIWQCCVR